MRATKFEFEYRFWIFAAIFFIGFELYRFDHKNAAASLLVAIAPFLDLNSTAGSNWLRAIFALGTLLVFSAAAHRTWATAYLRTEIVHDMSLHAHSVVADGPYRYVRNPLYLGNKFMAAGIGLMASRAGWVFIVVAIWLFDYRLILREEDGLLATQGETYRSYKDSVPRLLPSFRPRVPSSGMRPQWRQALAGESLFWMFGIAMLVFTITLDTRIMWVVFASGFVVYFVSVYAVKRAVARCP